MFQTKILLKIETHFLCSETFILPFMRHVEKYCRAGQATDDNMTHAQSMLDNEGYRHTLRICNTYCSSTATMVTRTRLTYVISALLVLLKYGA